MKKITKMTSISLWAKTFNQLLLLSFQSVFSVQSNRTIERWTNDMAIIDIKKENKAKQKGRQFIRFFTKTMKYNGKMIMMRSLNRKGDVWKWWKKQKKKNGSSFDTQFHTFIVICHQQNGWNGFYTFFHIKLQCAMSTYNIACNYFIFKST